jgi:hypothetical protein
MTAYDPQLKLDDAFYTRVMAFTFMHEFGPDILAGTLQALGSPQVTCLQELLALLWEG